MFSAHCELNPGVACQARQPALNGEASSSMVETEMGQGGGVTAAHMAHSRGYKDRVTWEGHFEMLTQEPFEEEAV